MKNVKFILLLMLTLLMTGCGVDKITVSSNPMSENDLVKYVTEDTYLDTGDNVTVTIVSKEKFKVCTEQWWLDGTICYYQTVNNGYSYKLKIVNNDINEIIAFAYYKDGYILYDNKYTNGQKEVKEEFLNTYEYHKGIYLVKGEFVNSLDKRFSEYYIYEDLSSDGGFDIFMTSSDYNLINELLSEFQNTVIKYKSDVHPKYRVYIYKDEYVFFNTNFDLYKNMPERHGRANSTELIQQITGKNVMIIGNGTSFDYDLFIGNGVSASETNDKYLDYNNFEYIVFVYEAEPNSFVGPNTPGFQILGVN